MKNRYECADLLARRIRQRLFEYDDESPEKGEKATRVLRRALDRKAKYRPSRQTDQFGATAEDRRSLARHGIAWGD